MCVYVRVRVRVRALENTPITCKMFDIQPGYWQPLLLLLHLILFLHRCMLASRKHKEHYLAPRTAHFQRRAGACI